MGCWLETDMMSGLPISYGEPCVGFLITPDQLNTGSVWYPTIKYKPVTPPIHGNYNDYGCLEDILHPEPLFSSMQKNFIFLDDTGKEMHYDQLDELLQDCATISGVHVVDRETRKQFVVYLVLIKKKFFSMALDMQKENGVYKMIQGAEKDYFKSLKKGDASKVPFSVRRAFKSSFSLDGDMPDMVMSLANDDISFAETSAFSMTLRDMRLQWFPTSGAGSQTSIENEAIVEIYMEFAREAQTIYGDFCGKEFMPDS